MRGGISMCALESGEGRPKFSGVSIGFSLSETRDGWMGICGYYRFILWVIHTLENCSITGHTYWIYSRHTYIYLFQTYLFIESRQPLLIYSQNLSDLYPPNQDQTSRSQDQTSRAQIQSSFGIDQ